MREKNLFFGILKFTEVKSRIQSTHRFLRKSLAQTRIRKSLARTRICIFNSVAWIRIRAKTLGIRNTHFGMLDAGAGADTSIFRKGIATLQGQERGGMSQ